MYVQMIAYHPVIYLPELRFSRRNASPTRQLPVKPAAVAKLEAKAR
jgi:hypothetical protein